MTPQMRKATDAVTVLRKVRDRLVRQGAVRELHQFDRLGVDELDLLVRLEREAA